MPPSLASRLLFQGTPPPTLVSAELTPELYDFIALALRAYVSPWWSKITRYDKDLLPHISTILSTVLRDLHLRAQAADLPALVFHDVPTIITQHYRDYHNAAAKTATAYASGGAAPLSALFAHLQPHMAISPDGSLDREYYRQIVDHILKASLPPDDYDPDAERIIIREIIVKVLLDDIFPKVTQPWFIHKAILDLVGSPEQPIFIVCSCQISPSFSLTTPSLVSSTTSSLFQPHFLLPHHHRHYSLCPPVFLWNVSCPHSHLQARHYHHQTRPTISIPFPHTPFPHTISRNTCYILKKITCSIYTLFSIYLFILILNPTPVHFHHNTTRLPYPTRFLYQPQLPRTTSAPPFRGHLCTRPLCIYHSHHHPLHALSFHDSLSRQTPPPYAAEFSIACLHPQHDAHRQADFVSQRISRTPTT